MGTLFRNFKKNQIDAFFNSITSNTAYYYVFASRGYAWPDDNNPPGSLESYQLDTFEPLQNMLFGKRVKSTNVQYAAKRYDWTSNTVYAQYDHTDISLFDKNFYVVTDQNHVFKCLFNNRGTASTNKPNLVQLTPFTFPGDGYIWKYMYTISSTDMTKFGSTNYIPITANSTVSSGSVDGIDIIEIVAGGNGYITSTNGVVQSVYSVNNQVVQIQNNARPENDFYYNCTMYITTGAASGQQRKITQYTVNSTGNWVTLESSIPGLVATQTQYEINPTISIVGDGQGAKAICRTSNGVINYISVIATGNTYTRANVSILANTSYGSGANLIAYIPPIGGHGDDAVAELGCENFALYMDFINTEGNTIITNCSYRTYGILKNPLAKANGSSYTVNTFSQVFKCNCTPAATTFTAGRIVKGRDSGSQARVIASNTTQTILAGDSKFGQGLYALEVLDEYFPNGSLTGVTTGINSVLANGDIFTTSPQILHMTNISPVARSNTATEVIKIVIQV